MKHKSKKLRWFLIAVLVLLVLRTGFYIKQIQGTSLTDALSRPNEITYVYKRGCPDCHRSNPYIFTLAFFSWRKVNFVAYHKTDAKKAQLIGLNSVPALINQRQLLATNNSKQLMLFMLGKRHFEQLTNF
ncbi:hypothetical protein [Lactiplantibacillus plantarum]|uniref:hypothetical protein n=1 Tax=Lactiplantibacillus plantarum TaxID=1590 RepID=UPI001BA5DF78|nr:hypothetical protein [Lactiplantibacillus plantarum]MBS0955016.1 hypothetical protein [Lactiplantibacillus plantarum]